MWIRLLLIAAVLVTVGWFVWKRLTRPRGLFEIHVDRSGVQIFGTVPDRPSTEVYDYVTSLRLPVGARIRGEPTGGHAGYRLLFSREVDEGERQQMKAWFHRLH